MSVELLEKTSSKELYSLYKILSLSKMLLGPAQLYSWQLG